MKTKGSLSLSTEEVAKAKHLAALGRSTRSIARSLHRSPHTVKRLLKMPTVAAEVAATKLELADLFEKLSRDTLESISTETISAASLQQRAVSAGIFIDKMRLLRDQPTEIIASLQVLMDVADMIRAQEDDDVQPHTQRAQRVLPSAPQPEQPASPVSNAAFSNAENRPASIPTVKVKYYAPNPIEDSPDESVLMRGLRNR